MSDGKGDTPRPWSVSGDEYRRNWDRAFAPKEHAPQPPVVGVFGLRVVENVSVPPGEAWLVQGGKVVGKIVGLG